MKKKKAFKTLLPIMLGLLILVVLAGCGDQEGHPDGGPETTQIDSYTIADATGDWGFPNPYSSYQRGPGYIRMSLIFETLVWKDADGFVPALAKSWHYDKDNNAYVFELKENVKWHDGMPFSADDVVFTFNYIMEHEYYYTDYSAVKSVTAEGNKVTITLNQPFAPFLDAVAGTVPIMPRHIWEGVSEPEDFRTAEAAVGTGPFKYGNYNKEHGTYLYLANDDYYGGKVLVKELKFVKVTEEMTATALLNGSVHAGSITPEMAEQLRGSAKTVMTSPYYWNAKLMINHQKEPLASKEMRQALGYAIDRQEIVDIAKRGEGMPGSAGLVPPDSEWFAPSVNQYQHNPGKTAQLLEGMGYTKQGQYYVKDGKALELELIYSAGMAGTNFTRDAELIKQQLESVGIKVNLRNMEAKAVDDRVLNWNFDLTISGHGRLGGDPMQMNWAILANNFNSARYNASEELTKVLKQQAGTMDEQQRLALVQKAQETYADELPALTLYYPRWYWAHDGRISMYYTWGGVAYGAPIAINRMAFVDQP